MRTNPRLGILVDRDGRVSITIIADEEREQEQILALYDRLKPGIAMLRQLSSALSTWEATSTGPQG